LWTDVGTLSASDAGCRTFVFIKSIDLHGRSHSLGIFVIIVTLEKIWDIQACRTSVAAVSACRAWNTLLQVFRYIHEDTSFFVRKRPFFTECAQIILYLRDLIHAGKNHLYIGKFLQETERIRKL